MKPIEKKDLIKLRDAFAATYREKEKTEIDEAWQGKVMDRIRSLGPLYPKTSFFEVFQRLLWRLAPVACILVLLLGVAITQIDTVSDYELTKAFIEDPADYTLLTLNGR